MSIPDFQSLMLPLLKLLVDEQEYSMREIIQILAWEFDLTDDQLLELIPSGQQSVFDNRVSWARTYLKKAGLVESPKRAFVKITDRGLEVIQQNLKAINTKFLGQYPEFVEFQNPLRPTNLDLKTNDDWGDDWEEESLEEEELSKHELDNGSGFYRFSVNFLPRKELLKLVNNKNGT